MSTMSEAIVLLWLVPVILNIMMPLAVLGCWLGVKFIRMCQHKVTVEQTAGEREQPLDRLISVAKN